MPIPITPHIEKTNSLSYKTEEYTFLLMKQTDSDTIGELFSRPDLHYYLIPIWVVLIGSFLLFMRKDDQQRKMKMRWFDERREDIQRRKKEITQQRNDLQRKKEIQDFKTQNKIKQLEIVTKTLKKLLDLLKKD